MIARAWIAVAIAGAALVVWLGWPRGGGEPAPAAPVRAGVEPTASAPPRQRLAPPRARPAVPRDTRDDEGFDEPVIRDGRFAGWPRQEWRDWYGERLARMSAELDEARGALARVERGELALPDEEIGELRMRVKDLTRRIEFDRSDLGEVERAR